MSDVRDPTVLMRHAVQVGDWRLAELLALVLGGHADGMAPARRAYCTLVFRLGLAGLELYDRG